MTDAEMIDIERRANRVFPADGPWNGDEAEKALPVVTCDVPVLVAEVRRLRNLWGDVAAAVCVPADNVAGVLARIREWGAAASTHEGIGLPGCPTCDPRTVSEDGPRPDPEDSR